MTDIYTHIAANFAKNLWRGVGITLGHSALAYGTHKMIDYVAPSTRTGALSWLDPMPKIKKGLALLGLEAAAFPLIPSLATHWGKASPIAEKLLTPSIKVAITPTIQFLEQHGYIILNTPSRLTKIVDWASKYHPVTIAHNLTKWWDPTTPLPTDFLGKL